MDSKKIMQSKQGKTHIAPLALENTHSHTHARTRRRGGPTPKTVPLTPTHGVSPGSLISLFSSPPAFHDSGSFSIQNMQPHM